MTDQYDGLKVGDKISQLTLQNQNPHIYNNSLTAVKTGNISQDGSEEYMIINNGADYFEQLSLGNIPERFSFYKFGRMKTVINKRVPMWDGNVNYIFPTTADTITITSSVPASDNPTGVGAQSVKIFGLDENFDLIDEIIALGATGLKKFIRVFRMQVYESGTTSFPYDALNIGNNVGILTATHGGTEEAVAIILPEIGQTLMAMFTVPKGYTVLLWDAETGIGKGQEATGLLMTRDNTRTKAPWLTKGIRDMFENTVGNDFKAPVAYTEKTDIVFAILGTVNNNNVSGALQMELVKN